MKEQLNLYMKEYRKQHKDAIVDAQKRYREAHKNDEFLRQRSDVNIQKSIIITLRMNYHPTPKRKTQEKRNITKIITKK